MWNVSKRQRVKPSHFHIKLRKVLNVFQLFVMGARKKTNPTCTAPRESAAMNLLRCASRVAVLTDKHLSAGPHRSSQADDQVIWLNLKSRWFSSAHIKLCLRGELAKMESIMHFFLGWNVLFLSNQALSDGGCDFKCSPRADLQTTKRLSRQLAVR